MSYQRLKNSFLLAAMSLQTTVTLAGEDGIKIGDGGDAVFCRRGSDDAVPMA